MSGNSNQPEVDIYQYSKYSNRISVTFGESLSLQKSVAVLMSFDQVVLILHFVLLLSLTYTFWQENIDCADEFWPVILHFWVSIKLLTHVSYHKNGLKTTVFDHHCLHKTNSDLKLHVCTVNKTLVLR